ncbi:hypothetical protein, partial [Thermococcus litoralis]|uniref:hypothetical protein n=1 Tax=Thermococcus litoralis TaxID=2265 RepID=UPI001180390A
MFVVGVLFLSSFAFAGQFQGVGDSQVLVSSGTCSACSSCQGFDVDKALREINLKIENLTRLINQKEAELHKLYAELNKTKSVETLEKIVKLEDEIQLLKSEKAFYERRKNDLIILSISYIARPYRQFKNNEINVYIKELEQAGINVKNTTVNYLISLYWVMLGGLFDEVVRIDNEIHNTLHEFNSSSDEAEIVTKIISLIQRKKKLWEEIRRYLKLRDELYLINYVKKKELENLLWTAYNELPLVASTTNCQWNANGKLICPEIKLGYEEDPDCCLSFYGLKSALTTDNTYLFENIRTSVVWVGMYSSSFPNKDYHVGDWCTYDFPPDNSESTIRGIYWERAQEIANEYGLTVNSIQIKFFYTARVYRSDLGGYQQTNLIFQYDCYPYGNSIVCRPSSGYGKSLFSNPQNPPYSFQTKIAVYPYVLVCKMYGDCGGYGCEYAKWANGHCWG